MSTPGWTESDSRTFLTFGDLFVPDREAQIDAICSVIDPRVGTGDVVEMCCGDGTLAQAVLERHPRCRVYGLDGSQAMLQRARVRLAGAGSRFRPSSFQLEDRSWRLRHRECAAVISSLAVHHLRDPDKQQLFAEVAAMLAPRGVFALADVMLPMTRSGIGVAARQWDHAVEERSRQRFGDERGADAFRRLEWNAFRYPDTEMDHLATIVEHLAWLEAAGFHPVDIVLVKAGHVVLAGIRRP